MRSSSAIIIQDERSESLVSGLLQLTKLLDSIDQDVIPCLNKSCAPTLQSCPKLSRGQVVGVHQAIVYAFNSKEQFPGTNVPAVHQPLTMLQWADCFVLQQWLIIYLCVSCLTHDPLEDNSAADFIRVQYTIQVANTGLEWCKRSSRHTALVCAKDCSIVRWLL